jgi:DnaJ-class molecular chaperone
VTVGELGSIFEADDEQRVGRPRGPDLLVTVDVPRQALGTQEGFTAAVPETLEHDGEPVSRAPSPDGESGVRLFLPETLPAGAVLRLRGQGGVHPDGVPGDLMVRVNVVEPPPRTVDLRLAISVAAVLLAIVLVAILAIR